MTRYAIILVGFSLLISGGFAFAEPSLFGHVKVAVGEVHIVRSDTRMPAEIGAPLFKEDAVETGNGGSVGITLVDNSVFSVGPNSAITLAEFAFDSQSFEGNMLANIRKGTVAIVSGDIARSSPGAMRVKTPTANLLVRGTRFLVRVGQ